jgi:hypothetical protein
MFKTIVFLLFLMPAIFGFAPAKEAATCDCPSVTNLHKTGMSSSSFSYAWTGNEAADQYVVWYYRQEGQFTSGYSSTTKTSFTFTDLAPGHYTFYVMAQCGNEGSNYIGIEDHIQI